MGTRDDAYEADDPLKKLDATLQDAAKAGEKIVLRARDLMAAGQSVADWAQATRDVVLVCPPSGIVISDLTKTWGESTRQAITLLDQLGAYGSVRLSSSTAMSAYSTVFSATTVAGAVMSNPQDRGRRDRAIRRIAELASRPEEERHQVTVLMKQFGLDRASGRGRSPLEQFETAHAAFETPVDSVHASRDVLASDEE